MSLTRSQAKKTKLDTNSSPSSSFGAAAEVAEAGPSRSQNNSANKSQVVFNYNSIYKNHDVIRRLGIYGGRAEVFHLRQMSTDYHKLINLNYLQRVGKILKIETYRPSLIFKKPEYIKVLRHNVNNFAEMIYPHGFKVTSQNWEPKIAHIFHRLTLNYIWYILSKRIFKLDGLSPKLIIHQISPYISTLDFKFLPKSEDMKNLDQLSQFMKQFTSLKMLNINYFNFQDDEIFQAIMAALEPSVLVRLGIDYDINYERVLDKYGNGSANQVETNIIILMEVEYIEELQTVLSSGNHAALTNLKFNIESFKILDLVELENYTSLCLQYQHFIEALEISLRMDNFSSRERQPRVEQVVERCLIMLSPIVTRLSICQTVSRTSWTWTWNLLDQLAVEIWPKLIDLSVSGCEYPLEILKTTKKLQVLSLDVNWINCIFHNTSKSPKQCVIEYFSNLCELEQFSLYPVSFQYTKKSRWWNEYEYGKDDLRTLLVDVLPKNTNIVFHERMRACDSRKNEIYAKCKRRKSK